jgi:2-phosphosulfolactate phosphatase
MNERRKRVEVCFTPGEYTYFKGEFEIVVVIDVLRATSAICAAFEHGVASIIPVPTIEEAQTYKDQGYLAGAERKGQIVEGFDFGNSPFSYMKEEFRGQEVVLTTTNGTKALHMARESAYQVVLGSFLNLTSLSNWLKSQDKNVLLLCAGWKDKFNLEDTLFAGAVVNLLRKDFIHFDDSCVAAEDMYLLAKNDLRTYLYKSSHSHRLEQLNIEADVQFCLKTDICDAIPVLEGERLVLLKH